MTDIPIQLFPDAEAWSSWLEENHERSDGLWMRIAKKAASYESVSYSDALDIALCWGWIDSQKNKFDDDSYLQKFTPRRPRSIWSKRNRERIERLMEAGRMTAGGIAQVEAAKQDGRWDAAYESASRATVPGDLAEALADRPEAEAFFRTLNSTNRYAIIFRLESAIKPETRARRLAKFVEMLENEETIYPQNG